MFHCMINGETKGWQYHLDNRFVFQDVFTTTGLFAMHVVWVDSHGPRTIAPNVLVTSDVSSSSTNRPKCTFCTKDEQILVKYSVHIYAPEGINPSWLFLQRHEYHDCCLYI